MNYLLTALVGLATFLGATFTIPTPTIWDEAPLRFGATNFPTSLDALTNPAGTDSVATVSHSGQHSNANDAIEALEAKLGIGASTPVTDSIFVGDGTGTSRFATWATTTRLTATNFLATGSTTLQAFTATNATTTAATTTNLFATTASSTNLFSTNATTTTHFATTASSTNLYFTTANGGNLTSSGLGTFANILANASSTFQNFTGINATTTNATTTDTVTTATLCFSGDSSCLTTAPTGTVPLTSFIKFLPSVQLGVGTYASSTESDSVNTFPFLLEVSFTVNKLRFSCTSGGADVASVGIYSKSGATKYIDTGTISCQGVGQNIITYHVSPAVTLDPGEYILAWATNNGASFYSWGAAIPIDTLYRQASNASTTLMGIISAGGTGGVLPATLSSIVGVLVAPPFVTIEN